MTPAGGEFATARRATMTPEIKLDVWRMREKGYGVQTIATITGLSMSDIRDWLSGDKPFSTKLAASHECRVRGRPPRSFNQAETRVLQDVRTGRRTVRGATREIGCSITAVRTWLAGGS